MKTLLRGLKRWMDRKLGAIADDFYWRLRGRKWAERYLAEESLSHPHRVWAVKQLQDRFPGFSSLLEVGCASGANLYVIHFAVPGAALAGMDINRGAIRVGKRFFEERGIPVALNAGKFGDLRAIASKSVEIVFTDAALIYLPPDKIGPVCGELLRIARKGCFFVEQHNASGKSLYVDHWVHDYGAVLKELPGAGEVNITKMPEELWGGDWAKYGCAVSVKTLNL